jgi:hypothetical protein
MKRLASSFAVIAVLLTLAFPAAGPAAPPLRRAKAHLEHAAHDFGGHRVEALRATDEALHQLQLCLEYDKE